MSDMSQYIYGIIPAAAQGVLDLAALTMGKERIGGDGVRAVVHADLAAIVSPAPPVELTQLRKDALAKMLVGHQQVIESVMQGAGTVLPFRLGTYVPSEAAVVDILVKGNELIHRLIEAIAGKIEMDVVVTWTDFASLLKEVGEEDEIQKGKAALAANPRGVSVEDQLKIGMMIKEAVDRKRAAISRQVFETLAPASCAHSRHENMDDQMIINTAFLLAAAQRPEFERTLDELDARFNGKLKIRCVGPLAPYSFYTLELKTIQWEDVDWARRLMGLGAAATVEEIQKAFHHFAQARHPDHHEQALDAEHAFDELSCARRIVLEYTRACEQAGAAPRIVFSEDSVRQNALLVQVRNGDRAVP